MPLTGLALNTSARLPPRAGDLWRINFSRVLSPAFLLCCYTSCCIHIMWARYIRIPLRR